MNTTKHLVLLTFAALLFWVLASQPPSAGAQSDKTEEAGEEGIPVKSDLVIAKCSSCHKQDDKGRLTRISYQRRTPEGWEYAIKRMVRLNGASLSPDEARQIVKYLSKHHGLAPEESRLTFYEAERRAVDEKVPEEGVRTACMLCHSLGRASSERRTREEWGLLANLHLGMFPLVTTQGFYSFDLPAGLPEPPGAEDRNPVDMAIDYFSKTYPLITPEWQAWSASVPTPRLEGRWLITGRQAGRGPLFGEMTIEPAQAPDEFTSKIDVRNLRDGSMWTRAGRGLVYAGHSWRGRSTGTGGNGPESVREAMLVSRDWKTMEGRWFWGSYDEFGLEVVLRRVGPEPVVAAIDPPVLKLPLPSERVTIHGTNLPADIKVNEIDFGSGIKVVRIVSARSDAVTVEVSVARDAASGRRDVSLRQIIATGAVVVFDKVDYIKALPGTGLARLGGIKYPKQHQQFEAVAYNRGPDGTPHTADDVNLGLVDAEWSIEEFPGSYFDDDREFVGTIDKQGLFTPAVEGPNPSRSGSRNNYGDVSIVASYKPDPASTTALKARCYLIVTLPLYVRWDTPEISR